MELLIKIPEEDYKAIKNMQEIGDLTIPYVFDAIRNGIPLPKHGDLIDRGELKTHFIGTEQGTDLEVYLEPTIINAPTIIESNKFSNNELENPFNDSRFGG